MLATQLMKQLPLAKAPLTTCVKLHYQYVRQFDYINRQLDDLILVVNYHFIKSKQLRKITAYDYKTAII